jgi:hypothetical protein
VQVAVSVNCYGLLISQSEYCLGSFAGVECLSLATLVGLQVYPFNAMLGSHGVFHCANGYDDLVALNDCNGDVLFAACFNRACLDLGHVLTAALHGNAGFMDGTYQVTALFANIEIGVRHNIISFFYKNFLF